LIKTLGQGSYGQVFLAREKSEKEKKLQMMQSEYPLIREEEIDDEEVKDAKCPPDVGEHRLWAIK
jgi:serine/threonine protein kinase